MKNWAFRFTLVALLIAVPTTAFAQAVFTEPPDFSSDAATPTPLAFSLGTNTITGSVSTGSGDTRDYITFTIAPGQVLSALRLITYQQPGGVTGNRGFHALNSGATSFIPGAATEANFLGGDHVDPLPSGTDLLPELSNGDTAGVGFTVPLGPGTYSYVIQQTGPQVSEYSMQFVVTAPPPVPAAGHGVLAALVVLLAAAGTIVLRRTMTVRHA